MVNRFIRSIGSVAGETPAPQWRGRLARRPISISACMRMLAFTLLLVSTAAAAIEAKLDRDSVAAGSAAMLEISISGRADARPEMPKVENLIIESRGQQKQIEIFNGAFSESTTYTYAVGSNTPGNYVIPAIEVTIGGKKVSTQPLNLTVLDAGVAAPPAQPGQQPATEETAENDENRFGFLTVELADSERKHAYVGEIAPVRIRAWIPAESQANLRSGIQPEGKGFTLHNLSQRPQQTQEMKDGKRYIVVTWFGGISATKAGKHPASLSVNATVAVRDTSAPKPQRRRMGGPFDDPFFDSVFDRMNVPIIQKDVTLRSVDQEIEVRPLPTEGRPAGFTGAVGEFNFIDSNIPDTWKTGEPQQIIARLSGTGNFALMNAPDITPAESWKTYEGKNEFRAGDQASFSGTKAFQFSAVPRKGGEQEVALEFSYFDPAAAAYKTIVTPAKKIQVSGEDIVDLAPAAAPEVKQPEKKEAGLIGQHSHLSASGSLVPLVSRPEFARIMFSAAGLCVIGGIFGWLRKRDADPKRRALAAMEIATREALDAASKCAASRDVSGYFAAARLAIQQRLGSLWNQPAQAITLADVSARMPADSPVVQFFREADLHEYSRQSTGEVLPQWRALFDEAMASLTPSAR